MKKIVLWIRVIISGIMSFFTISAMCAAIKNNMGGSALILLILASCAVLALDGAINGLKGTKIDNKAFKACIWIGSLVTALLFLFMSFSLIYAEYFI